MAEQKCGPLLDLDLADQLTELKINEVQDLFAAENIIVSSPTNSLADLRIQTDEPRTPVDQQNKVDAGPGPGSHTTEVACAGSGQVKPQQQASCESERSSEDAHKIKLIQQQMVLLLHTHRCRQLDAMDNNRQCNLPLCLKLRPVVEHVADCTVGNNCSFPLCKSSKKIISHWSNCLSTNCPVCWPIKLVDQNRRRLEFERS